jgi:hypothetical protein
MDEHEGALVFWYQPDPERGARLYERHYSGLTQAYYARELQRAGAALEDREIVDAAKRVFAGLLVPVEKGGVYFDGPHGTCIAEVPQQPNSWILNGWQSALLATHEYGRLSGSEAAADLVARSARSMAEMLHLYDVPDLRNSRYGLTGFTYARLRFTHRPDSVTRVETEVPGEGRFPVGRARGTRWQQWLFPSDVEDGIPKSRALRMNLLLSLASHPEPNRLALEGSVSRAGSVALDFHVGRYEPLATAPVSCRWVEAASADLVAGRNALVFDVPSEVVRSVVYPTNFLKRIHGKQANVYHAIHIKRLHKLADAVGVPELEEWARTWSRYVRDWAGMDLYRGLYIPHPTTREICEPSRYP